MRLLALLFLLWPLSAFAGCNGCQKIMTTYTRPDGSTFPLDVHYGIPQMSMSFTFMGGPCDGGDMNTRWTSIVPIIGPVINDWRIRPWTLMPVMIRSISLTKLSGGPHTSAFIGNNYTPDVMVSLGAGVNSDTYYLPDGTGFYFPGTSNDPGTAYFDAHIYCTGGGVASYRLDVVYALTANEGSTGVTQGSTPGSATTTGFAGVTWFDRSYSLNAGAAVYKVGFYSTSAATGEIKIGQRVSAGQYTDNVTTAFSHPGGGWADFSLTTPFQVPSTGTFNVGAYVASGTINYQSAQARAWAVGNVAAGATMSMSEDTSAMMATRATY